MNELSLYYVDQVKNELKEAQQKGGERRFTLRCVQNLRIPVKQELTSLNVAGEGIWGWQRWNISIHKGVSDATSAMDTDDCLGVVKELTGKGDEEVADIMEQARTSETGHELVEQIRKTDD